MYTKATFDSCIATDKLLPVIESFKENPQSLWDTISWKALDCFERCAIAKSCLETHSQELAKHLHHFELGTVATGIIVCEIAKKILNNPKSELNQKSLKALSLVDPEFTLEHFFYFKSTGKDLLEIIQPLAAAHYKKIFHKIESMNMTKADKMKLLLSAANAWLNTHKPELEQERKENLDKKQYMYFFQQLNNIVSNESATIFKRVCLDRAT